MFYGDYHSHTVFSHGKGTIEDNVRSAISKGLKAIAITDHGVCNYPKNLHPEDLDSYFGEIVKCRQLYPEIKVLVGLEVNLVSPRGDIDLSPEGEKMFDVLVFGFHGARLPTNFKDWMKFWLPNKITFVKDRKKRIVKNTDAYVNAMLTHRVGVIAHPNKGVDLDLKTIGNLARDLGVFVELNSESMELSDNDIDELANTGCKFIASSDAHSPERVGDFSGANRYIELGFDKNMIVNWQSEPIFRK